MTHTVHDIPDRPGMAECSAGDTAVGPRASIVEHVGRKTPIVEFDEVRMAKAIHASGIANCIAEQCNNEFGGFSGADHDMAVLLIRQYNATAPSATHSPEAIVARLNAAQRNSTIHPYTCVNRGDGKHVRTNDLGVLVATVDGWMCPSCDYRQSIPALTGSTE